MKKVIYTLLILFVSGLALSACSSKVSCSNGSKGQYKKKMKKIRSNPGYKMG